MSERADTIRQRMESDVRRSLHSIGQVSDFMEFGTYEVLVDEVVDDAMHHIEHLLVELEDIKARDGRDDRALGWERAHTALCPNTNCNDHRNPWQRSRA